MSSIEHPGNERGLSRRAAECGVAVILLALASMALWDSYSRGAGWNGGPQSGFFPARVAWVLLIASAVVLFQGIRREPDVIVTWSQLRQVALVFVPLIFYVLAITYVGIYLSSALFIAGFMLAFGSFRWWSLLLASVLIPVVTFWVFELQFQVPLPKGPLEAFFGY